MMMPKQKYWLYGILILAVIGIVLISGCIQEEVALTCPASCDDNNLCTTDYYSEATNYVCKHDSITPCCGNGVCEAGEAYSTCPQDCPKTTKDVLEENIPEIKNFANLEQVFINLYAAEGFSKEEIDFMKVGLKIYKEKPMLEEYPRETLLYLMSRSGGWDFYDAEFFNKTLIPLAKEITANATDDLAAIKAIQRWVNDNIVYDYFDYDYITPENILRERRGVCGEYSVLIAALARATGIPARVITSDKLATGKGHAWVEAYVDGDWISIDSTGAADYDKDGLIEYSDLERFGNNKMVDVFIKSPYDIMERWRTDITFGYNNHIIQQMITKVESMLKENRNLEAKERLESAKDLSLLWEVEKSTENRHAIGREAMEHLLRAVAILEENITSEEVQVAFLEDFPMVMHTYTKEGVVTPYIRTTELAQYADIKNPLAFWKDFQETLVSTNPKVLYLFDATYAGEISIEFAGKCHGIDFCMLRTINELIKSERLDTKFNFILYWSDDLEKIEFLGYEDIEPVISLTKVFHEEAEDFMWNFIEAINSVKDNLTKTSFYLPPKFEGRYAYYITAVGPFIRRNHEFLGYGLSFKLVIESSIGELPLILELHGLPVPIEVNFPTYTNLIIVDESGNVFRPEVKDGKYYYPVCPSTFVNLNPGQNLIIERQGDFIKITETGEA